MTQSKRYCFAALCSLIMLQLIMLLALFAGLEPHPPKVTPLFGIAPFLGASMSLAISAMIVRPLDHTAGRCLSVTAALTALVSFGPHKFLDAQFALIWPAVILGQLAAFTVIAQVLLAAWQRRCNDPKNPSHA